MPVSQDCVQEDQHCNDQQTLRFQPMNQAQRLLPARRQRLTKSCGILFHAAILLFRACENPVQRVGMLNYGDSMADSTANPPQSIVRFGIFEADLISAELRKNGTRLRLQEQPFRVLTLLLESPGQIVTREELRQKLWPADTFVDFDHSLNTVINKLREALGDSAANPRFVETVAKRGYRFLAPVTRIHGGETQRPHATAPVSSSSSSTPPRPIHPELDVPLPHRSLPRGLFALVQIMYLVFYLEALLHWSHIERAVAGFLSAGGAFAVAIAVLVTGAVGIVLRCYLLSAITFDYQQLRHKFEKLFLAVLLLDDLWALAPFLLAYRIGFGSALAATAALLYVPFAERTLLRMVFPKDSAPHLGTATINGSEQPARSPGSSN
jgi:DNA-binding winged helix-turn-helix (wHTH) protein